MYIFSISMGIWIYIHIYAGTDYRVIYDRIITA